MKNQEPDIFTMPKIIDVKAFDIRFPTSNSFDGSDAMNPDPDYSAAYVILLTDKEKLEGHGLTFTIGRGNELCVQAIVALSYLVKGKTLQEITSDMAGFWKLMVAGDSQLRWVGPEKGVIHMAVGALVNAVWDLYAKLEQKPLWRLIVDMSPEQLISCIDFSYITDVITPQEALDILIKQADSREQRVEHLLCHGYPAYTTSAGWLGYDEPKIRRLCQEAVKNNWTHVKIKVGSDIQEDLKRAAVIRQEIGPDTRLMMDANQKWDVLEAIENIKQLSEFDIYWFEEPTSPDDILGHKQIAEAIKPIKVASGEHCQNRVMFKQLIQSGAIQICQIDSCRVGGVNELLAIMLMAAKFDIPVCPHAGGVGLCEYVQHLSMIDYISISGVMENRIIEYVDHLHEHFLDPVVIKEAHYMPPQKPGFSIEMKPGSRSKYQYPDGEYWSNESVKIAHNLE